MTRRAPSVRIALRTFWRTLKHGFDNIGTLLLASVFWLAGLVVLLPVTLLIVGAVEAFTGQRHVELVLLPMGVFTAALHRVTQPMSEERAVSPRVLVADLRRDAAWSTLLMAVLVAVLFVILLNIGYFINLAGSTLGLAAFFFFGLLVGWAGVALYVFPVALRQADRHVWSALRSTLLLSLANAPGTIVSLLLLLVLCAILLLPPLFLLLPATIALWGEENARMLLVASGLLAKDPIADRERE